MEQNGAELLLRQRVKLKLDEHGLTNKWLVKRLQLSGVSVTPSTLSTALTGARTGPQSDLLVLRSWNELMFYERRMKDHAAV